MQPKIQFKQPPLLFRNTGQRFENASTAVGSQFIRPVVARGAAYADYDRDGDLDVLVTTNHGPATLYRNDGGNATTSFYPHLRGQIQSRRPRRRGARESASGKQWRWCAAARATARRAIWR